MRRLFGSLKFDFLVSKSICSQGLQSESWWCLFEVWLLMLLQHLSKKEGGTRQEMYAMNLLLVPFSPGKERGRQHVREAPEYKKSMSRSVRQRQEDDDHPVGDIILTSHHTILMLFLCSYSWISNMSGVCAYVMVSSLVLLLPLPWPHLFSPGGSADGMSGIRSWERDKQPDS